MPNPMSSHRSTGETNMAEPRELTVGQLTERIKDRLQTEFSSVWVVGEISDLARPQSGHVYLTLKDDDSQIRGVIWRATAQRIDFPLDDGCEVLCRGDIDVYPPRGTYQLIIRQVEQRGEGALQKKLRELQKRLAAEGLFEPHLKQPLPRFPNHVAVITSPTGAAVRDFLQVAARRWRGPEILVMPTLVQGAAAAQDIAKAIGQANRLHPRPDVIVVTRGGGSMEDLWCFNDEAVVRAIHKSTIPVVSAIGHEIDVTLADLVADVRATTPSEAAERVFLSSSEVSEALAATGQRMAALLHHRVSAARSNLSAIADRSVFRRPFEMTQRLSRQADELALRSMRAIRNQLQREQSAVAAVAAQLEALSPLKVLGRGYSVTQDHVGEVVTEASQVAPGDVVTTRLDQGKLVSQVTAVEKD
jgi:exodeoxyribonuclease VII large subunit